jgi:hypothetical protein
MVQTLTVRSNGTAEINTGNYVHVQGEIILTQELQSKIEDIEAEILAEGISEIHVERDTFREFEHAVKANEVLNMPFGSTVSVEDFDWIMQHVDVEKPAQLAAEIAAALAFARSQSEPDLL